MSGPRRLACLLVLLAPACASNRHVMTPRIAGALVGEHLGLPIETIRAQADWIASYGQGLVVEVRALRTASDYRRDLDLELDGAARVCAALARLEDVLEWDFLEVVFTNAYGRMPPRDREVAGVARVVLRRDTLGMLRERKLPAPDYPRHWDFIDGYKDQPDAKELLSW